MRLALQLRLLNVLSEISVAVGRLTGETPVLHWLLHRNLGKSIVYGDSRVYITALSESHNRIFRREVICCRSVRGWLNGLDCCTLRITQQI
jgi:hypothetical protein